MAKISQKKNLGLTSRYKIPKLLYILDLDKRSFFLYLIKNKHKIIGIKNPTISITIVLIGTTSLSYILSVQFI